MALIHCPECDKEISDKVKACPHCGYPLIGDIEMEAIPQQVEVTAVNLKSRNPIKTKRILVCVFLFTLILIGVFFFLSHQKSQKAKEEKDLYINNLTNLSFTTLLGAEDAESLCNLTGQVWRNTIYEESDPATDKFTKHKTGTMSFFNSDFNDSLLLLFQDSTTVETVADIKANQTLSEDIMKQLATPPEGLEKCYDSASEMYSAYQGLTDLAISPSGNLQSFAQSKSDKVDKFMEQYKKLQTMIPETSDVKSSLPTQ